MRDLIVEEEFSFESSHIKKTFHEIGSPQEFWQVYFSSGQCGSKVHFIQPLIIQVMNGIMVRGDPGCFFFLH